MALFAHLSFRKKIFLTQLGIFILFLFGLIPFGRTVVHRVVRESLEQNATELIKDLTKTTSTKEMVSYLEKQKRFVAFDISLIDSSYTILYDSRWDVKKEEELATSHAEVSKAFKQGSAFDVSWSEIFDQKLAYVALRFPFHDTFFVLRISFPFLQVQILERNFQLGLSLFGACLLLVFLGITGIIFLRLTQPIESIIRSLRSHPFPETIDQPLIPLSPNFGADFTRLAETLNSLSKTVKLQIEKILEDKNEKEMILETLLEGVIALDNSTQVIYINNAALRMLGATKENIYHNCLNRDPSMQYPEIATESLLLLDKAKQEEKVASISKLFTLSNKKTFLDIVAIPISITRGSLLILQDKTDQHKMLEMGKEFIANASHELRTPITIVKGFAETLADIPNLSHSMLKSIVDKIVRNCERMDNLIKNLLTLADIDQLSIGRFQDYDLGILMHSCVETIKTVSPHILVDLKIDTTHSLKACVDKDLLELAFMNFLQNSVKYSTPPAHLTIAVFLNPTLQEIEISIQDEGIGIPEEEIENIFNRFYTVNKAHSRKLGGAGLGLSIAKTILDKHKARIKVTSLLQKGPGSAHGTTIFLWIPQKHQERELG